jgi:serine/threonine-protein kinase
MGSVWVADHLALNTQVAIKFMSPAYLENRDLVQRFRTEAMAAAQIKSPHVAQVFDHGFMTDGTPYIVMELLEGEDLKRRIRREGPLPPREVSLIIAQAAKALSRAHQVGIVHRDIKPDNIFLTYIDGELLVKVLDFGIAKLGAGSEMGGATTTGSMMGTPLYMSPEQLLSAKRVDHRADLWSLAVVAYHALTGRVPFNGETVGSLSVAVHGGVFEVPSRLRPGLSPALDAWFQRALRKDPNERFATAKELAETLDAAIAGQMAPMRAPMASYAEGATSAQMPAMSGAWQAAPPGMGTGPGTGPGTGTGTGPGPTLAGTALPTRAGGSKTALIAGVALSVVLAGALGVALFMRSAGSSESDAHAAKPVETAAAAPTTPPTVAPVPPPSVAPAAIAEPSPTASATAAAAPTNVKPAGTVAPSRTPTPPSTSTAKAPTTPKKPASNTDTIGF